MLPTFTTYIKLQLFQISCLVMNVRMCWLFVSSEYCNIVDIWACAFPCPYFSAYGLACLRAFIPFNDPFKKIKLELRYLFLDQKYIFMLRNFYKIYYKLYICSLLTILVHKFYTQISDTKIMSPLLFS